MVAFRPEDEKKLAIWRVEGIKFLKRRLHRKNHDIGKRCVLKTKTKQNRKTRL